MPQLDLSGLRVRGLCPRAASERYPHGDNLGLEKVNWNVLEVKKCLRLGRQNIIMYTLGPDF